MSKPNETIFEKIRREQKEEEEEKAARARRIKSLDDEAAGRGVGELEHRHGMQ